MDDVIQRLKVRVEYPKINPYYIPIEISQNEIQFRVGPWSGPVYKLKENDQENKLARVIGFLDGDHHIEEIINEFGEEDEIAILALIKELYNYGVVYNGPDGKNPLKEYSLLKPYLSDDDLDTLHSSSVLMINSGEIGGYVVEDISRMNVGQIVFTSLDEGTGRDGLVDRLDKDNVEIVGDIDLKDVLPEFDLVVYTSDHPQPSLTETINQIAYKSNTPWTVGQIYGLDGLIGPTIVPDESCCYSCFKERIHTTVPDFEQYVKHAQAGTQTRELRLPSFGRVIAGCLTIDIINVLASGYGFTVGNVIHYNFLDLSVEVNRVLKLPRCSVCGVGDDPGTRQLIMTELIDEARGDQD